MVYELAPGKTYAFFSHTIKGQPNKMDMLRRLMELQCQLIDYERITDERGRKLIFFSRFAGLAGATDSLWALARRLEREGVAPNPFAALEQTYKYATFRWAESWLHYPCWAVARVPCRVGTTL